MTRGVTYGHDFDVSIEASCIERHVVIFKQGARSNCGCSFHVVPACWVELRILPHEFHNVLSKACCLFLLCLLFGVVLSETVAFLSMLIAPLLRMKCSNASMGETETIRRYIVFS